MEWSCSEVNTRPAPTCEVIKMVVVVDDGCYYSPDRFTWIARPPDHRPGWHSGRWSSPIGGVRQPSCPRGSP
ncbi:hypothetical protein E2C01_007057 [Portunus trituberculatus]|uniref:Uncharacterized protein n=1 Tax=Portunus trituberculatus TaxID=210409 RepID=A0A5B7CZU9_PORTR|nr:hypothetical protein [Portunus trituberculatus]